MHIDMTGGKPLKCSKCGSTNAVKPLNSRTVAVRCADCGHTKLTREAEQRELDQKYGDFQRAVWQHDKESENTF